MSDAETERRMLETAADAVAEAGLTVSLDHIRLEDVIREAGVSRSAVYRKWPSKGEFLGDLLLELSRGQAPIADTGSSQAGMTIRRVLDERFDDLGTPEGRRRTLAEIVRETAEQDFRHIVGSRQWRTYLALTVTFIGMPGGELRDRVGEALAGSERTLTSRISRNHEAVGRLLAMRPARRDAGWDALAHLANALMRGMVVKSLAQPELADRRITAGVGGPDAEWTLAALGVADLVLAALEDDPDVEWDDERAGRVRAVLATGGNPVGPEPGP
ncbi:TetR/AcrR family transcriptional regulator [Pseudonocardia endophytica]|uniref:TetR family transcriptional regulator n=1 Tax=Pseudonocardia endophytica TaxID=401976 RepID=A0A4V2PJ46_PSEEN|nr:TetR family transcriptional regulator [Pseudonocardia endophytica]TCK27146.1 TetR family transcriptional regulator [Pseudonocardia endophytica]